MGSSGQEQTPVRGLLGAKRRPASQVRLCFVEIVQPATTLSQPHFISLSAMETSLRNYVGVPITIFGFPYFTYGRFAAQPKEFFLDGSKKLEQRSHKCVEIRTSDPKSAIFVY
jgi:hypothetical protein